MVTVRLTRLQLAYILACMGIARKDKTLSLRDFQYVNRLRKKLYKKLIAVDSALEVK
jgi:hypothetical protein